jgi:hypothetical protein
LSRGRGLGDFLGAIAGVIIDDDQFPLGAEGKAAFRLGEERVEAGAQRSRFVAGRHDDGKPQLRLRGIRDIVILASHIPRHGHRFVL